VTSQSRAPSERRGRGQRNARRCSSTPPSTWLQNAGRSSSRCTRSSRARLSAHAFYQLFESKEALTEAVLEESLERGVLALRELVDAEHEPMDRLRAFVVGYHDLATSSRQPMLGTGHAFRSLAIHLSAVAPAKSWKTFRPLRVLAYELLRAAAGEAGVRSDLEIDLLAGFILSTVSSMTELAIDEPDHRWPDGDQLWQLIADGIT
jgi:AcrR family transcriptional regulator